jgi:hypothetical protein
MVDYSLSVGNYPQASVKSPGVIELKGTLHDYSKIPNRVRIMAERSFSDQNLSTQPSADRGVIHSGSELKDYFSLGDAICKDYIDNVGPVLTKLGLNYFPYQHESEFRGKLTWQKGGLPYHNIANWPVSIISHPEQARRLEPFIRNLLKQINMENRDVFLRSMSSSKPSMREPQNMITYPRHTNHGYPTFTTSDQDLNLHVRWGLLNNRERRDIETAVEDYLRIPPCGFSFSRTGPISKFQPLITSALYRPEDHLMTFSHDIAVRGWAPRRRVTIGIPTYRNVALIHIMKQLKTWLEEVPWCAIGKAPDSGNLFSRSFADRTLLADDISAWDMSISYELQEVIAQALVEEGGLSVDDARNWLATENMQVACGIPEGLFIRGNRGGISSGIITTSVMGSIINKARFDYLVSALRIDGGEVIVLGDDSLISLPKSYKDDSSLINEWSSASEDIGLKSTVIPEAVFLMRSSLVPSDDLDVRSIMGLSLLGYTSPSPMLGRLVQQWGMPERMHNVGSLEYKISYLAKFDLWKELIRSRCRVDGDTFVRFNNYLRELWKLTALSDPESVRNELLRLNDFKNRFTDLGATWARSAEHSPVSKQILSYLTAMGLNGSEYFINVRHVHQIISNLSIRDREREVKSIIEEILENYKE